MQTEKDVVVPISERAAIAMVFVTNHVHYFLESVVSEKVASSVHY